MKSFMVCLLIMAILINMSDKIFSFEQRKKV